MLIEYFLKILFLLAVSFLMIALMWYIFYKCILRKHKIFHGIFME